MDPQLENSHHKREHDENNGEQNKRKKYEMPEQAVAMTKFTDVKDDCLEHIFKHLLLPDMINIADTCKRFQASAQSTFALKCSEKDITLVPSLQNQIQPITLDGNTIVVSDLTSCLKLLRHFGGAIPNLHISYYYLGEEKKSALAWYMNKYVADSLVEVVIDSATNELTTNWTKSFSKVETIELCFSDLDDLSAWFPNLRHLILSRSSQCIKFTLPHLEELKISIGRYECDRASTMELLRFNQDLQILHLSGNDCDMKFMESVSRYLQSVRLLDISCGKGFFNTNGTSIYLKSVNELHITLLGFYSLPKIPFTFDQLDKVKLTVHEFNLNDNIKDFIKANSSLTKLTICFTGEATISIEQIKSNLIEVSTSLEVGFEEGWRSIKPYESPKRINF